MDTRVVVVSGPAKGTLVRLLAEQLSVGRDAANSLCLRDPAVSRRHFAISKTDSAFQLIDLESHNGTFVNGIPVRRKLLTHGDNIRVGRCELVFLITDETEEVLQTVQIRDTDSVGLLTTTNIRAFSSVSKTGMDVGRMARDLNALFKITSILSSIRDSDQLQQRLLELLGEVIPADSGAILILRHPDEDPSSSRVWYRKPEVKTPLSIRRELIQRALWERSTVLSRPTGESGDRESVLCVPLVGTERTVGVVYMTADESVDIFRDDHVHFLTSVATMAAVTLENVLATEALRNENRRLQAELNLQDVIIGESRAMKNVHNFIGRVAKSDSTVLVRGESGTGKELVARAIHRNSPRARSRSSPSTAPRLPRRCSKANCSATRRARSPAPWCRSAEASRGGRRFHVPGRDGRLAPAMQAKLLRVVQEREFERVGGRTRPSEADIRLIAATNRDLEEAVSAEHDFAAICIYRLNVVAVNMPALRERREDILPLANYFVRKHARSCTRQIRGISPEVAPYPDELRMARQRARAGEYDRARYGDGNDDGSCPTICPTACWKCRHLRTSARPTTSGSIT